MKPNRIVAMIVFGGVVLAAAAWAADSPPNGKQVDKPSAAEPTSDFDRIAAQSAARVRTLIEKVKQVEERQRVLVDMLRVHREKTRQECGLSPENVVPTLLSLERDAFQLSIELSLKQQRRRLLEEQIAKSYRTETTKSAEISEAEARYAKASLEVARAALEKVIEANRKVPGTIAEFEIHRLKAEVVKAEAQLEVALIKAKHTRASANIVERSQKHQDLAADTTIDELRLKLLDEKIKTLNELRPLADRCEHISSVDMAANHKLWQSLVEQLAAHGVMTPGTSH